MSGDIEKICLVDMDGTVADLEGAVRRDLLKTLSATELSAHEENKGRINTLKEMIESGVLRNLEDSDPGIKARLDLIKVIPGFWENLEVMPDGMHVLEQAESIGFNIHILTQGPRVATTAWSEKFRWYRKHICERHPNADITITRDKGLVYGTVLVDDHVPYVERWLSHRPRGLVIMPDRPYNRGFEHPQVHRYKAGGNIADHGLAVALQKAFSR